MMSLVSIVKTDVLNYENIKNIIKKSIEFIDYDFKHNYDCILIKPNLFYYSDFSTGETTHPKFVEILIDVIREQSVNNPDIYIIESDASAMRCKYVYKMLGYEKLSKHTNVPLINLSQEKYVDTNIKISNKKLNFLIPEIIINSDLLINVPKIKYQVGTKMTCALKNIFGCNAYQKKHTYHKYLNEAIVGINKLIKSNIVLIDGLIISGMNTKKMGMTIASKDPVAIDTVASELLGINPNDVKYIQLARCEKLGKKEYTIKGENLQHIKQMFPKKERIDILYDFLVKNYLKVFR